MVTVRIHSQVPVRVVVVAGRLQRVQRRRDGESSSAAPVAARSVWPNVTGQDPAPGDGASWRSVTPGRRAEPLAGAVMVRGPTLGRPADAGRPDLCFFFCPHSSSSSFIGKLELTESYEGHVPGLNLDGPSLTR